MYVLKLGNNEARKVKVAITFLALVVIFSSSSFSDEIATTADGKQVILHEDGTYTFLAENEINEPMSISFTDFLIDSESLVGKDVIILGVGGFRNDRNEVRPRGSIYQEIFTIGPSISIDSSALDRASLVNVHECPLKCNLEVSGEVKMSEYGSRYIEATSLRVLESIEFRQLNNR